jgi:hypothetical protein
MGFWSHRMQAKMLPVNPKTYRMVFKTFGIRNFSGIYFSYTKLMSRFAAVNSSVVKGNSKE